MPVPSSISDISQTAASNDPAGSESPNTTDDYLRTYASFIAQLRDGSGFSVPATLASATTTNIGAQASMFVEITGTTAITGFGTTYNGPRFLRFTDALTLTHNATTLNLPGAANITTAAGDTCIAIPNSTGNGWNVVDYQIASLSPGALSSTATATTQALGDNSTKVATTAYADRAARSVITGLSASVSSNALTISCSAITLDFRSTTLGSGSVTTVTGDPDDLVISSGSTLGTANGVQSEIAILAINNSGTIVLAAVNLAGGVDLSERGLISTTAEGGAGGADSATTIYSTSSVSNKAYRVLGTVVSTQATAGTWATSPSLVQGAGGNALTSMSSIGYGQTWQDVTGSRTFSTNYTNTTARPILVQIYRNVSDATASLTVDGVIVSSANATTSVGMMMSAIVPAGSVYSVSGGFDYWVELR